MKIVQILLALSLCSCVTIKRPLSETEISIASAVAATIVGSAVETCVRNQTRDDFASGSAAYITGASAALCTAKLLRKETTSLDYSHLEKPVYSFNQID